MEYKYDVFLSFTGADRNLKDDLHRFFVDKEDQEGTKTGWSVYDSDIDCISGGFRVNYVEALSKTKVYLMILSDSVLNDPNYSTGSFFSEVRKEGNLAADLESRGLLNIIILNLSEKFINPTIDRFPLNDFIGRHFYSLIQGFTRIDAALGEDGLLTEETKNKLHEIISQLVTERNLGHPVPSQQKPRQIRDEKLPEEKFFGRQNELNKVEEAFSNGKQIVFLRGLGGIGKTCLATAFARYCNSSHSYICPQIVSVRENNEQSNKYSDKNRWIDEIRYQDSVLDSLRPLTREQQRNRKMNALTDLGENVLLVIDNFNDVRNSDVDEMLQKLKCKILITTRAKTGGYRQEGIESLDIGSLDEENAYKMFCEKYGEGPAPEFEDFKALYKHFNGHTITLCIIAKIMKTHELGIDYFLGTSWINCRGKVEFVHNENTELNTVYGHLADLFSVSGISPESEFVLKNLCLLNDGIISSEDLKSILGLDTNNEINELEGTGWIDTETRDGKRCVILHPLLSELLALMLKPKQSETRGMISYLLGNMSEDTSFENVHKEEERYYFAVYRLARSEGALNSDLWNAFTQFNHLLGDTGHTKEKVAELTGFLSEADSEVVTFYSDMVTLEYVPSEMSILDKYVGGLEAYSSDYKAVMRALSVTAQMFMANPQYQKDLERILDKAMDCAMNAEDDFSVMELFKLYYTVGPDTLKKKKRVFDKYLRTRKNKVNDSGVLVMGEMFSNLSGIITKGGVEEIINTTVKAVEDDFNSGLLFMVRHPVYSAKMYKLTKKIESIPKEDSFYFFGEYFSSQMDSLMGEMKFDSNAFLKFTVDYYRRLEEHGVTFASLSQNIVGVISVISSIPEKVRTEIDLTLIDWTENGRELSFDNMARQHVAALINAFSENYTAAIQNYGNLLFLTEELYSRKHPRYAEVLVAMGEAYLQAGNYKNAYSFLKKAFIIMKEIAPGSTELGNICIKLLDERIAGYFDCSGSWGDDRSGDGLGSFLDGLARWKRSPEQQALTEEILRDALLAPTDYMEVFDAGKDCFSDKSYEYVMLLDRLWKHIYFYSYSKFDSNAERYKEEIARYVRLLTDAAKRFREFDSRTQLQYAGALAQVMYKGHKFGVADHSDVLLECAQRTVKQAGGTTKNNIQITLMRGIAFLEFDRDREKAVALNRQIISKSLRYGISKEHCLTAFSDNVLAAAMEKDFNFETFFGRFTRDINTIKRFAEMAVSLKEHFPECESDQKFAEKHIRGRLHDVIESNEEIKKMLVLPFHRIRSKKVFYENCFTYLLTPPDQVDRNTMPDFSEFIKRLHSLETDDSDTEESDS